jgi:transposase
VIRHLHVSEGMSVRAIAKQLGLSRVTVTRAVQAAGPPQYHRGPSPSAFDEYEHDVRRLLQATVTRRTKYASSSSATARTKSSTAAGLSGSAGVMASVPITSHH